MIGGLIQIIYNYSKYTIWVVLNWIFWGTPSCTKVTTIWENWSMPKLCSLGVIASRHSFFESGKSGPKFTPELPSFPRNWRQLMEVFVLAVGK